MKKITDKQRLDWLETQTYGRFWVARQSTTGRGYRLHNCDQNEAQGTAKTAREAIDIQIREEQRILEG